MRYETVHSLSEEDFKRSTRVQPFAMRQVIEQEPGRSASADLDDVLA
jgi:hypothetical protein